MAALLLATSCGDKDWDEEIVLQIFKEAKMTAGTVTVTAVQDGKKIAKAVNADGAFFNSCETNRVRIIPAQKGGAYSDVNVTVTSGKISASKTIKVPATAIVQIVLGSGSAFDPKDCKPSTTTQLKETGVACSKDSECEGGRCLLSLVDGSKKFGFKGGYCTATCMSNPNVCDAPTCSNAPAKGEKDCCYPVADGYGKKTDAVCLKRCGAVAAAGCRTKEGYTCTPGSNCFPK